ncbi:MAG: hypothetical protein R3D25_04265 [Geminicoccaceae bacterium]
MRRRSWPKAGRRTWRSRSTGTGDRPGRGRRRAGPGCIAGGHRRARHGHVHSHAFQRGMAGLAERAGPAEDSFWTWREVMYGFSTG